MRAGPPPLLLLLLLAAGAGAAAALGTRALLAPAPLPAGPSGPGEDAREEIARLRAERDALRAERDTAAAAPAPPPSPASPDAPPPSPGGAAHPERGPASPDDVRRRIEALRAAVAAGDPGAAERLVAALARDGDAAVVPLEGLLSDRSQPAGLRAAALRALATLRPDLDGRVLALLLSEGAAAGELRATALDLAAGPAGGDPAVARLVREALLGFASAGEAQAAFRATLVHDPDAAVAWAREAMEAGDAARGDVVLAVAERGASRVLLPVLADAVHRPAEASRTVRIMNALARAKDRPWSAVQATGAPDTPLGGDHATAWAPKNPNMGVVWLELEYERAVIPEAVRIRETLWPGAVTRVLARVAEGDDGWTVLWEGTAPTGDAPRWFEPPISVPPAAVRVIRIVLDTDRVSGWNEIDAVELVGDGAAQWAVAARASSSYAD